MHDGKHLYAAFTPRESEHFFVRPSAIFFTSLFSMDFAVIYLTRCTAS